MEDEPLDQQAEADEPAHTGAGAEAIDYLEGADVEPPCDELEEQQGGGEAQDDAAQEDRAPAWNRRRAHRSRSSGAPVAPGGGRKRELEQWRALNLLYPP